MSDQRGSQDGYVVLSYILAGPLFYGGLGWWGDHILHTNLLLPLGFMLGAALGLYTVVKRFGGVTDGATTTSPAKATTSAGEEESQ